MRALDIKAIAHDTYYKTNKKTLNVLQAFSDGVNAYIENNQENLPFEFGALDYKPKNWEPVDCILIGKALSLEMSLGMWTDITFGEIADKYGQSFVKELIPGYPDDAPCVLDEFPVSLQNTGSTPRKEFNRFNKLAQNIDFRGLADTLALMRDLLGLAGSSSGSNAWAMKRDKNQKSPAILANDPHLNLSLPAKWYQIHISYPGTNLIGMAIPGIPFIVSGRNDNIAWGVTNLMADNFDYFVEKIDSTNKDYYFNQNGIRKKFVFKLDTIQIKNSEEFVFYSRRTERSNVISDFHLLNSPKDLILIDVKSNSFLSKYCITYRWTSAKIGDDISAFYKISRADNWNEFKSALSNWISPCLNIVYADRSGNMGVLPVGVIPQRSSLANPDIPSPGWIPGYDWSGYTQVNDLGYLYNPPKKYVLASNNKLGRNISSHITSFWEPSSRAERVDQLLSETDKYYVRNAQIMQYDQLSPYAKAFMDITIPILEKYSKGLTPKERYYVKKLKSWDYIVSANSELAALYNVFYKYLVYNTFHDDLGERLYRQYLMISNLHIRKILEILDNNSNRLFDIRTTSQKEDRNFIVFKSLRDAVNEILSTNDSKSVRWGDIHKLTLNHIFSKNQFLRPSVTLGPLSVGGNLTTINNSEWRVYNPYDMVLGPSMRIISDMGDSVVYTNLPGGTSGEAMSPHYRDQVQLWLKGGYVKIPVSPKPHKDFKPSTRIYPLSN
jgi:penicillin amidase